MAKVASGRYTLLLDEKANARVEFLQKALALRSRAAVFDMGTSLLSWYVEEYSKGYRLGKSDGQQFQELFVPVDSDVVKRASTPTPLSSGIQQPDSANGAVAETVAANI